MSTTPRSRRMRLVRALFVAFALTGALAAHAADEVYGLEILPWAKKLDEEGRYQSPRDYEQTKKFFKDKFKGWKFIRWHAEVSLPSVKYVHVENTAPKRKWDGVNIYELPGGHVRIFVLPHVEPEVPAPAKPTETAAKPSTSSESAPPKKAP